MPPFLRSERDRLKLILSGEETLSGTDPKAPAIAASRGRTDAPADIPQPPKVYWEVKWCSPRRQQGPSFSLRHFDSSSTKAEAATVDAPGGAHGRVAKSFALRVQAAKRDSQVPVAPHTTNGDEARYADKSGTYTKCLLQDGYGRVNLNAYQSMKTAFATGNSADFEKIIMGGARTLNGPQGALAFDMEGCDSVQFGNAPAPDFQESLVIVPPPPAVASAAYGTELVEMYWCSLLRDVAFTKYAGNPIAIQAAAELSAMPDYAGPRNGSGRVTPNLLFRGIFPGETMSASISQFMITPTALGQQPISQQLMTYLPGIDYMTDLSTWSQVQNGIDTGLQNQVDPQLRYLHNGRGLASFTHVDVLYQAYFTAFLVLNTLGVPLNPGNPYVSSKTQNGFCTFGGPDMAACLGEIAARALDRVWYQKWMVHLRHRPESGGGLVHLIETGQGDTIDAKLNKNVLASEAVQASFNKYGSYLLSQTFPEGSPAHPLTRRATARFSRLHYPAEVLLRWKLCHSRSAGSHSGWPLGCALQRFRCRAAHGQWGTEQACP